jgi:type IV pilus assembly protein PilM
MAERIGESVAVDLGTGFIKVVVTDKKGAIAQTVVAPNNLDYSVPLKPNQIDALSALLKQVFDEHKLPRRNLRLAMPERLVSTQVIEIPTLTDSELASSITWQAQQYIPIPKEDLALNYEVLYRPDKKDPMATNMRVLLVGISQTNVNNLVATYTKAGLETTVLETESIATIRHVPPTQGDASCMVINFGSSGMDLAIIRNNELSMVISHQTGSSMITKALISAFNLPADKAEEYKHSYGIDPQYVEGKVAAAIVPVAQMIINNIKNTMSFYNSKNSLQTISRIYLCGGGALMPGFLELLVANLNLEVVPLDIFANLTGALPAKDQALFPVAAGLTKRL